MAVRADDIALGDFSQDCTASGVHREERRLS
jgi:hypothetical protein